MNNKIKFLRGTSSEYAAVEKDNDTIYFTTDNSNLYIGNKKVQGGNVAESTTVTLSASSWSSNSQIVSSSIVTANNVVIVSPVPNNQDIYSNCGIKCTSQSSGSLVFTCSTIPDSDINVNIVVL